MTKKSLEELYKIRTQLRRELQSVQGDIDEFTAIDSVMREVDYLIAEWHRFYQWEKEQDIRKRYDL